jgi:hypothetical protein
MLNLLKTNILLSFMMLNYFSSFGVVIRPFMLVLNMFAIILIGILVLKTYKSIQDFGSCANNSCQQIEKKKIVLNLMYLIGALVLTIFIIPGLIKLL